MSFLVKFFEFIKQMLISWVEYQLGDLFETINREVGSVEVSATPKSWNNELWELVTGISDSVILPLAGCILAFVLCFELISILNDKNNMHSGSEIIYGLIKSLVKMMIAVLLVKNAPEIIDEMFQLASEIVSQASGYISGNTNLNPAINASQIAQQLESEAWYVVVGVLASILFTRFVLLIVSVVIKLVVIGRMVEIYIYCSIAPIPMATLTGKEINSIGINYVKSIAALAMQSFFIMICLGIYSVLIQNVTASGNLGTVFFSLSVYAVVLAFSIFKTGQVSKSIFTAH